MTKTYLKAASAVAFAIALATSAQAQDANGQTRQIVVQANEAVAAKADATAEKPAEGVVVKADAAPAEKNVAEAAPVIEKKVEVAPVEKKVVVKEAVPVKQVPVLVKQEPKFTTFKKGPHCH